MKNDQLDRLVESVLKSSKHGNVCTDLIRNIGKRELSKRRNLREAVKSTKNKLHQVAGAHFLAKPDCEGWLEKLRESREKGDEEFRKTCVEIMNRHKSTVDRLKVLDEFYEGVFSLLPSIHSVIDVACGLHPLAIPWMPLPVDAEYYAYDVYVDLARFLNGFMGLAGVDGCAEARDVVGNPPDARADLAFVLNTVPCLERIEKSAGMKVLGSVDVDFLVVSFPIRSLSGREKGMREFYDESFHRLTQGRGWTVQRSEFGNEIVFIIEK